MPHVQETRFDEELKLLNQASETMVLPPSIPMGSNVLSQLIQSGSNVLLAELTLPVNSKYGGTNQDPCVLTCANAIF